MKPAALCCAYHRPAVVPLVSLRDFGRPPVHRSRVAVAVAERSEGLGPAGEGRPAAPAPPSAKDLLQQLTAQEREQVTQDVLRAFLEVESHSREAEPDRQQRQRPPRRRRADGGGAGEGERQRGLQGQVVQHLLSGGFDEALLEGVPTHTLNWVLKVLGQQGGVAQAEQLFHWMRLKGRANQHSFVKLCEACGAARQPWRAMHAWRNTRRMPQAPAVAGTHAAAALVLAYRSTADHRGAMAVLDTLLQRGFPVNRFAFNAAIRVCADAAAPDDALLLLGRLRQAAADRRAAAAQGGGRGGGGAAADLRTDCFSYSAALAAVTAAGRWNRGGQLHRWLAEDGLVPDAPLCAQLLSCYAAMGQAAAAQQLVDAMLAGPLPPPNRTHWNALLLAFAAAQDVQGCVAAYRRMLAAGLRPDGYTMLALLRAAFHARHGLAAVRAVQREMAARGVPLNRQLGTAMLCCLRHVRPAAGPGLQLRREGDPPRAGEAAAPLAVEQPQQLVGQPREQEQEPQAGQQQREQGRHEQQAEGQQQQQQEQAPDEAKACLAEAAAVFGALRAQARRQGRGLDLRAYNSLLLVQLAAGDHAGALSTFGELEGEERLLPDGITLGVVIAACQAAGWCEREAQFRQLLRSSSLLGALGGDGGGGGAAQDRRARHEA